MKQPAVCLPTRYRDELSTLYTSLSVEREFSQPSTEPQPEASSITRSRIETAGLLRAVVEKVGKDFENHLADEAEIFQLHQPLLVFGILEVVVDRFGDDFADIIDRFEFFDRGVGKRFDASEMRDE